MLEQVGLLSFTGRPWFDENLLPSLERGISGYPGDAEMVGFRLLKRQLLNS